MAKRAEGPVQAEVHAGAWKLGQNEVWNVPEKGTHEVRFDIKTRGPWGMISGIAGLAIEPDGRVWGWRKLSNPQEDGYVQRGTVSVGGQNIHAFTSSRLFEREDGSLCDVAVLYICRPTAKAEAA